MLLWLLVICHILAAAVVTGHVLLTKADARSMAAWLAIVWFSPLVGSLAYPVFGINRIARRADRLRTASRTRRNFEKNKQDLPDKSDMNSSGSGIIRVGDALSGNPVVGGNSMAAFANGDEAYPEMVAAIDQATKTIALSSYIFRLDETGLDFVNALASARERGVDVKVIVDGFGGGVLHSPVIDRLNEHGIDARRFLFSFAPWDIPYLNLRNHKKLLIIDGETGFVGGMNLGIENILRLRRKDRVRDVHFCFRGPIVGQLLKSFIEDWHFVSGDDLQGDGWVGTNHQVGTVVARVINSGPDHELGNIESLFATAIACAQHHISIATPYFLPDQRIGFLLELAAIRGVEIDLIVPEKTDFRMFDWALESQLGLMDLSRINCYRSREPFDHSKLVTVDHIWCAVGSPNWDVRSMRLNFEILVECHDHETVGKMQEIIDRKKQESKSYTPHMKQRHSLIKRLRNASARMLLPYF